MNRLALDIPEYALAQQAIMNMEADISAFISHVSNKGLCLQAGGGKGNYPAFLSRFFRQIVSVEANSDNYAYISRVLKDYENIRIVHAGLWNETGKGSTKMFRPGMELTYYITDGSDVDLITIDSLNLIPDLIWLDIEGSEYKALCGAAETLRHCNAVIIEEADKGLEKNVGSSGGEARSLLESLGYKQRLKRALDFLFIR